MKKLFVFIILVITLSSCFGPRDRGEYDDLNKHKGEVIVSKKEATPEHGYLLYLKKENDSNLANVVDSYGEYDYYQKGDTIK